MCCCAQSNSDDQNQSEQTRNDCEAKEMIDVDDRWRGVYSHSYETAIHMLAPCTKAELERPDPHLNLIYLVSRTDDHIDFPSVFSGIASRYCLFTHFHNSTTVRIPQLY